MAKKSSGTTKDAATTKKAPKKAAVKKTVVKKAPKAATPAAKTPAPKATKKSAPKATKTTTKKSAPKKASAPKLNDRQVEFLKKIQGAGEIGYASGKGEDRTIEALSTRKLVKRGKKNASTGKHHYTLTKTGHKHVGAAGTSASA